MVPPIELATFTNKGDAKAIATHSPSEEKASDAADARIAELEALVGQLKTDLRILREDQSATLQQQTERGNQYVAVQQELHALSQRLGILQAVAAKPPQTNSQPDPHVVSTIETLERRLNDLETSTQSARESESAALDAVIAELEGMLSDPSRPE